MREMGRHRRRRNPLWKQPGFWYFLVMVAFFFNLLVAILTLERHVFVPTSFSADPALGTPLMGGWRYRQPKAQLSTERRLWHRLLLQQEHETPGGKRNKLCSGTKSAKIGRERKTTGFTTTEASATILKPFGFSDTVREYVEEREQQQIGESPSGSEIRGSLQKQSLSKYCLAPPSSPSCESFQYTVIIYSSTLNEQREENKNNSSSVATSDEPCTPPNYWRNLVVQVMKFLSYPSVERINLMLQVEDNIDRMYINETSGPKTTNTSVERSKPPTLVDSAEYNKYATRILNWNKTGVINVISVGSLWDALEHLDVPSESVLWIDGDHSIHQDSSDVGTAVRSMNGTVLKTRLRTWREAPSAIVLPEKGVYVGSLAVSANSIEGYDYGDDNSINTHDHPRMCSYPLLHGLMMHTNYLCYLNHPVVGSDLRKYTNSLRTQRRHKCTGIINKTAIYDCDKDYSDHLEDNSWQATTIAIGMLLFSIGEGYIVDDVHHFSASDRTANIIHQTLEPNPLHASRGLRGSRFVIDELSKYFGCHCPTEKIPRWRPSTRNKCGEEKALSQ